MLTALDWIALTVYQEAGGEPFEGQLAVANVIVNRMGTKNTAVDVVLSPFQFSCWNTDSRTRAALDTLDAVAWERSLAAAAGALYRGVLGLVDPTKGATHYLNEAVVLKAAGKLPSWFNEANVTARIGRHTFLR